MVDSNGEFLRFKEDTDSAGSLVLNTVSNVFTTDSDGNGNNFQVLTDTIRSVGRDSADEARGFGTLETTVPSLTGLPAIKASNPTSKLAVICDGTAESIAKCISIAEDKQNDAYQSLIDFTTTVDALKPKSIGGGGLMGAISAVTSALSFASNLTASFSALSPVAELNGAISKVQGAVDGVVGQVEGAITGAVGEITSTISDAVSNVTLIQELNSTVQGIKDSLPTLPDMDAVVGTDVSNIKNAINDATNAVDQFNAEVDARVNKGLSGVLQNMAEGLSGTAASFIANLVPGGIVTDEQERQRILEQFGSGNPRDERQAIQTLTTKSVNVSDRMKGIINEDTSSSSTLEMQIKMIERAKEQGVPEQEVAKAQQEMSLIAEQMAKLDTTISGTVVIDASLFEEGLPVSTNKWDGRNSDDDVFTYIASVEELDAEFTNVNRDVTEVVVHATDTHTNKDIGSIEINNIQIDLGHDGIGYHYVIRRDGRLQRGRPVNEVGDHAPVNGHDKYSIGIAPVSYTHLRAHET